MLRKQVPMGEMRDKAAAKDGAERHETTYQSSRGGWHKDTKPHQDKGNRR